MHVQGYHCTGLCWDQIRLDTHELQWATRSTTGTVSSESQHLNSNGIIDLHLQYISISDHHISAGFVLDASIDHLGGVGAIERRASAPYARCVSKTDHRK